MRLDPTYRPITADEFLEIDFGTDKKFELVDGVIQMMTGGSAIHARVSGNIFFFLRGRLRGTSCQPFNSDMGVRVDATNIRYSDVAVYCDKPWDHIKDEARAFDDPKVIFEVLSPTTTSFDQGTKLEEYRRLPSVNTVAFIDPVNELTRVFQRVSGDSWHDGTFAQPHDIELPSLGLTIPHAEIYARD